MFSFAKHQLAVIGKVLILYFVTKTGRCIRFEINLARLVDKKILFLLEGVHPRLTRFSAEHYLIMYRYIYTETRRFSRSVKSLLRHTLLTGLCI